MDNKKSKKLSKFISYLLRHKPEKKNLTMDIHGWVSVEELLTNTNTSMGDLQEVVKTNNKKRFEFDKSGTKIRARQGHSIEVDLGYKPVEPPETLYHGTADKNIKLIKKSGLKKMNRHAVHMSPDEETAKSVGGRHGKPIILKVKAKQMHNAGYKFTISNNNVWLTEQVPAKYIEFP